jgi:hypothetical protein
MAAADAPGPVTLSSTPRLFPSFAAGVTDYVVTCKPPDPVELAFDASGATRVSVNGGASRGGRFTVPVKLAAGRGAVFSIDAGPDAGTYHLRCLPKDFPGFGVKRYGDPQAAWYVLSLGYNGYDRPDYTAIFDNHGVPVWWMRQAKAAPFNGSLLPDGTIAWYTYTGHGFGVDPAASFVDHALDGRLVRRYRVRGGPTDFHELQVLPNHHALLVRYKPRDHVDLSKYGKPRDARVLDGEIQEVDRHGKVVWSWSTKGHIPAADAKPWFPHLQATDLGDGGRWAWDIAHLNSIDRHGNTIVISLRHTDAVYEIDRSSGKVLWKLGGRKTSKSLGFVDDPLGGSSFAGQHDARLSNDGSLLTVFDNRSHGPGSPRAVLYRIDRSKRTATLIQSITDPLVKGSGCCGSARRLPGGNWVISWGRTRYVTETDALGNRVLSLDFGGRTSYRAIPVLPGGLDAGRLRAGMDAMAP